MAYLFLQTLLLYAYDVSFSRNTHRKKRVEENTSVRFFQTHTTTRVFGCQCPVRFAQNKFANTKIYCNDKLRAVKKRTWHCVLLAVIVICTTQYYRCLVPS